MKRKLILVLSVALIIMALGATAVFAAESVSNNDEKGLIRSMFDAMRSWSEQAKDRGEITEEQAQEWEEHFDAMEKYHEKYGFSGHCGGFAGNGSNKENQAYRNYMPGLRNGMMGRF